MQRKIDSPLRPFRGTNAVSRFVRRLIILTAATVLGLVVVPGPVQGPAAHACSCANSIDNIELLQESTDATFLGTVVEIRRPELALSSAAESRFIFDVETVFKGNEVRARQAIVTESDGASCGLELAVGATAIVFARNEGFQVTPDEGEYASNLCEVIASPSAMVLDSLGEGRSPKAGSSPIGADDGLPSTVVRNWYWIAALIVGAVAAVFGLRRRTHRAPD